MKKLSSSLLPTILCVSLLAPLAGAFTPYRGKHKAPVTWIDNVLLERDMKPKERLKILGLGGRIKITSDGDPYHAEVRSQINIRNNTRTFLMILNPDGSARIIIAAVSRKVGRSKSASFATKPGSTLKFKTQGSGTWEIQEGVKTKLKFRGKTNGIPTRITGYMDLTEDGKFVLDLKAKYKKGNELFSKPSTIRFGP
ncbi:MAG: hypothetical protein H7A50_08350 [Akkermansiaceae bacterium]|nr:hypothetical protein [Akkermansiaceae bacterium]